MPQMTANRDVVLSSLMGHRIVFRKGVAQHVPPECMGEALSMGIMPEEGDDPYTIDEAPVIARLDPHSRSLKIDQAIVKLSHRNARNDFTAAGLPKVVAVERVSNLPDVSAREIAESVQRTANAAGEARTLENQLAPNKPAEPGMTIVETQVPVDAQE